MSLTPNAVFLRKTHIGILAPAIPLLIATACVSSPYTALLFIPLSSSAILASILLYRNKQGYKTYAMTQLLGDVVLAFTYLGLMIPIWAGSYRPWWVIEQVPIVKLESYTCALALISMTIHSWFSLTPIIYYLLRTISRSLSSRVQRARECPKCRAREDEEARGLLGHTEHASPSMQAASTSMMRDGARYMLVDTDASPRTSEDIRRTLGEGEA
ncbi:hypothetical protein K491DRAFT_322164 [Lophiostoma macrostomum CBS 122681]|uniref:Uncharacterized protein n=1 Tax=Lophiostoma macrostomum CBS 122681 TaxID=1314788 RepID=A0A6A6SKU2_9PLEO|nr:hypothetical protein K491DRAFT_322164 [Lophiostoma macrostomum CBS 122681]